MRQSTAAIALIFREVNGKREWLAQWNANWNCFSLIGGHKNADESFRNCVIREVQEELGLTPQLDFTVAEQPKAQLRYSALSQRANTMTDYQIELFDVFLTDHECDVLLGSRPENRWISEADSLKGKCTDGQKISETVQRFLQSVQLTEDRQS